MGEEGEQRLSHFSSMVGESEQVKRQLKEVLTSHGYEILLHAELQQWGCEVDNEFWVLIPVSCYSKKIAK
jgi:hypothetical protein